jgi:hypothetical protein
MSMKIREIERSNNTQQSNNKHSQTKLKRNARQKEGKRSAPP